MSKWLMIYDECYVKVIKHIKERRKSRYTQKEFAKLLEVTQKTISCYESCQTELNLKQFIEICHHLELNFFENFSKLFEEEYEKEKYSD